MLKKRPVISSILSSVLLLAYVSCVSCLMHNGEKLFGKQPSVLTMILLLLLLVFSALICGLLLLGGPIYLYFEGNKKTAIKMLFTNAGFLAAMLFTAITLMIVF